MPAFTKKSYTAVAGALFALLTPGLARGQVLTSPNTVGEPATTSPTSSGHTKIRALAVVEFAGEKPTSGAYRLVPITVYENGHYRDAQLYAAQPTPMSLESGTIYEIEQSGKPIGYATVGHTGTMKVAGTDYAEWYGVGYFNQTAPDAALKTAAPSKIVFDDKKEEHRVYMPQDKKNRGGRGRGQAPPKPNDKSGGGQAPSTTGSDDDSDHPTLKRRTSDDSGQTTSSPSSGDDSDRPTLKRGTSGQTTDSKGDSSGQTTASTTSSNDPDHPTLKKRPPQQASAPTQHPEMPPQSVEADPNHPRLARGRPTGAHAVELPENVEFKDPHIQVLAAVSDPTNKEARQFHYDFNAGDEQTYRTKLLAMAIAEAKRKSPTFSATPMQLQEVNLRAFDLSLDNSATLVLTATAPGVSKPQYLTLVARVNIEGELERTFFQLTDRDRFDISPRMQLVDAVDADGDGRGELLFRLQSDQAQGWGIYRCTADGIRKLFDDLPPGS